MYVVVGKHDIAVNPEQTVQQAQQTLQHATTKVADAGHMITIEKRDWLMDEMLKFYEVEEG